MENKSALKDSYREKMNAQIHEWNAKLDELAAKAEKAKAQGKIEYYKIVEGLREKQKVAQIKWNEIENTHEDGWESLKAGAEKAWHELKQGIDHAISKFH